MRRIKNIFLVFAFILIAPFSYSLPGISQYIPDSSGEYVYYADSSFTRESYIGILYYNDGTYAFRYYAPVDKENHLLEKDITIYFAIDTEASYLSLTGERIEGETEASDAEIINYLHDIFYEFVSRRQDAEVNGAKDVVSQEEFMQFGGNVKITYNALVPIFNIKSIQKADGTFAFRLLSAGHLHNSSDMSFSYFKGLPSSTESASAFKKEKGTKSRKIEFEGQKITLDTMWEQKLENMWLLGDYANITINVVNLPKQFKGNPELFENSFIRRFTQGTELSYSIWQKQQIKKNKNSATVNSIFYEQDANKCVRDIKVLTKLSGEKYAYLSLTVFEDAYQSNKSYFDSIIKSYKVAVQ